MSSNNPPLLDNTSTSPVGRQDLIVGQPSHAWVTDAVCGIVEQPLLQTNKGWLFAFSLAGAVLGILGLMVGYLFFIGVGVWNLKSPVGWGFDITNFVFWVGIGHAGTLISAILFLFRQRWRTSINRAAEAMTIFAVICALVFPGIHVGRVWFAYWMLPYFFNGMGTWPNFRSPLDWDVFAVSTYFTISLLFWFLGLVPDIATLRDRAISKKLHPLRQYIYGLAALGWRNSTRHWQHYERAYLILAGIATPLVLSVHSVVSFDFATSVIPGWHTTIFPPYFVAGAIFSGFAMVVTLLVPCRQWYGLQNIITMRHLENMNKIILLTGTMVGFAYLTELFIAYYSGSQYEWFAFQNRIFGPYWWAYWTMFSCNVIFPQIYWFRWARTSIPIMMVISLLVNVGMWFERFVIIVTSLHRDYLPSAWGEYYPSWVEIMTMIGSFGLFFFLFCLFVRFLPFIAISEVKGVMAAQAHEKHLDSEGDHGHSHDAAPSAAGNSGAAPASNPTPNPTPSH